MKRFGSVLVLLAISSAHGAAQETADYLPLGMGDQWELRSPVTDKPITFEVIGKADSAYRVRWDNPWIPAELQFVTAGNQVLLQGIDMGQGVYTLPTPLLYFDFAAAENASWSNAVGEMTILSRHKTVSTPTKRHEQCIEIRITDDKGESNYWTFAPEIGFVQFGQGPEAFVLSSKRSLLSKPGESQRPALLIGIDSNPSPAEGYTPESVRKTVKRAVDAGMTYMHMAPKWDELEPMPGEYKLDDIDFSTGLCEEFNLAIELGIRIVDTNQRSMPKAYANWAFDDKRLAERLDRLLRAVAPRFRGRVKWITIGNEVNAYFDGHKNEITPYVTLMKRVLPTVRDQFRGALFTINLTSEALPKLQSDYAPLVSLTDFLSLTYYPLNPDFTVLPSKTAVARLKEMMDAAGNRKVLFQEIGCPSSTLLNSSEEIQAQFLEGVFAAFRENKDRVLAANILWMSDIAQSLVDEFGKYYKLPNSDKFKAYLATLGLFDRNGKAKKAWSVFQREAQNFSQQ